MDESESIAQLLDNLQSKLNLATKRFVTEEQVTTWNSKLLDVYRTIEIIHNPYVPVNLLPIKILHHIFNMVLQEYDSPFGKCPVDPVAKALLNLTAVCKKWRHEAIANPHFWRKIHIRTTHSPWRPTPLGTGIFAIASEFLVRSRPAPLSIKITLLPWNVDLNLLHGWMSELSREFYRLEEIDVVVTEKKQVAYEELDFYAPNLRTLTIKCPGQLSLFPPIFKSHFPSLRKLSLKGFKSWPTDLFTNLTSLSLEAEDMPGLKLLDVLEQNSTLTELIINDFGPKGGLYPIQYSGRLIDFPSLQFLRLENCNFEFILVHISFPQTCEVTLYDPVYYVLSIPGTDDRRMTILSGVPPEFILECLPQVIESLYVEYSEDEFQVFVAHLHSSLTINQTLSDDVRMGERSRFVRGSFLAIANCQAFNSISKLSISGPEIDDDDFENLFSQQFWDFWFFHLRRLKKLELHWMELDHIFKALLKKNPQGNLPCAKLRTLEVEIEMDELGIADLYVITDFLKGRYIMGLPLKYIKVQVDSPPKKDDWEDRWKKYVAEAHLEVVEPDNLSASYESSENSNS